MNVRSLVTCFVWNHQDSEKFATQTSNKIKHSKLIKEFYHDRLMYIVPFGDNSLITQIGWSGCFLMSGVRMLRFPKDWWKFIQIQQYYRLLVSREKCNETTEIAFSTMTEIAQLTDSLYVPHRTLHIAEEIHLIGISTVLKFILTQSVEIFTFWWVFRLVKSAGFVRSMYCGNVVLLL